MRDHAHPDPRVVMEHIDWLDRINDVDRDALLMAFLQRCWPSEESQDQ